MTLLENRLDRPDLQAKQILTWYSKAEDQDIDQGTTWYAQAHQMCQVLAHKFCIPLTKVAGVVAALSPATNWQQNIADTHNLLLTWYHMIDPAEVVVTTYGMNKRKAINIINLRSSEAEDIVRLLLHKSKVNKTASFFWNILRPSDEGHITVDRHALRIALGNQADTVYITEKRYRTVAEAYRIAADKVNISPIAMQAITWTVYRKEIELAVVEYQNSIYEGIKEQVQAF